MVPKIELTFSGEEGTRVTVFLVNLGIYFLRPKIRFPPAQHLDITLDENYLFRKPCCPPSK